MSGDDIGLLVSSAVIAVTLVVLFVDRARRQRRARVGGEEAIEPAEDPNLRRTALFMQYSFIAPGALAAIGLVYGGIVEKSWVLVLTGLLGGAMVYGVVRYINRVSQRD